MKRRATAVAAAMALASGPAPRASADEPCVEVTVSGGLPSDWAEALEDVRVRLGKRDSSECSPMSLSISAAGDRVLVVATTKDGRHAQRWVRRPNALVATVLGLTTTIPPETAPRPSEEHPAPSLPPAPPAPATGPRDEEPRNVLPRLWMGASIGLRLTAPTSALVLDVETRADLILDHWLAFATIRSGIVSCLGEQGFDCDVYTDVGAGVGLARRLRAGASAIDLGVEPSLAFMHMEYDVPQGGEAVGYQSTQVVLFLDGSARLGVPIGSTWFLTLTADAGVAPTMLVNPTRVEVPASARSGPPYFPAWMGGVRLGASGALL